VTLNGIRSRPFQHVDKPAGISTNAALNQFPSVGSKSIERHDNRFTRYVGYSSIGLEDTGFAFMRYSDEQELPLLHLPEHSKMAKFKPKRRALSFRTTPVGLSPVSSSGS